MEIQGVLKEITADSGTSKAGKDWENQTAIIGIDQDSNYPKDLALKMFGKSMGIFDDIGEGQEVKVQINIDSKKSDGKWWTNASAWKVEAIGETPAPKNPDDLPF